MRVILGAMLLMCSGCYRVIAVPIQKTSSQQYKVADRSAVWSQALMAFQLRGLLIATSDPAGGLLRSEDQPGWTPCSNVEPSKACKTTEQVQLTIGTDGSAFVRRYMSATGWVHVSETSPFSPSDLVLLQKETDAFLSFIVGTSKKAPEPPPPPPPGVFIN
jgi:hypothetical protein